MLLRVLIIILLSSSLLFSQSEENQFLQEVNPELLEELDISKVPESPNKINNEDKRTGQWTLYLSKTHKETDTEDYITYYRIANFENGKYKGIVKDYDLDNNLVAEGRIKNGEWEGETKFYKENKLYKVKNYSNGKEHREVFGVLSK